MERMGGRKRIGLFTADPETTHVRRILEGVMGQCEKYDYDLFVFASSVHFSFLHTNYVRGEANIFELANFDKLDGVILSTVIADVFIEIPWESYAVFTSFFGGKEARCYWKRQSMYTLLAILVCGATCGTAYLIPVEGFSGLFLKGAASAAVSSILLLIFLRDDARLVLGEIRHHMGK